MARASHGTAKEVKKLLSKLVDQGWRVKETTTGHWKAFSPDKKTIIIISGATGDPRGLKNIITTLKRGGFKPNPIKHPRHAWIMCELCGILDEFAMACKQCGVIACCECYTILTDENEMEMIPICHACQRQGWEQNPRYDWDAIRKDLEAGMTRHEVAKKHGVSRSSINHGIVEMGIQVKDARRKEVREERGLLPSSPGRPVFYDWDTILTDVAAGELSRRAIAEKHGISYEYLLKRLGERGLYAYRRPGHRENPDSRQAECPQCGHAWTEPVTLSKTTWNLSGEASVYCSRCGAKPFLGPTLRSRCNELALLQRGEPEEAMRQVQFAVGGGVLIPVVENVGDIIHRMNENVLFDYAGCAYVADKVKRSLYYLEYPYGFQREMEENIHDNARYWNISEKELRSKIDEALERYAQAHAALPTFNDAQRTAQAAAVAVGKKDWATAIKKLHEIREVLDQGEEAWIAWAHGTDEPEREGFQPNITPTLPPDEDRALEGAALLTEFADRAAKLYDGSAIMSRFLSLTQAARRAGEMLRGAVRSNLFGKAIELCIKLCGEFDSLCRELGEEELANLAEAAQTCFNEALRTPVEWDRTGFCRP